MKLRIEGPRSQAEIAFDFDINCDRMETLLKEKVLALWRSYQVESTKAEYIRQGMPAHVAANAVTKLFRVVALVLVFGMLARAQDLPDKPQPRTVDKPFLSEAAAMGAAWTADTVSTHQIFSESPHYHELGYFFTGSRSTAKVMGAWAAVDVGAVVAAYEWKKHVHNRYLHPLWHAFMLQRIEAHTDGAIHNGTYPDPRP